MMDELLPIKRPVLQFLLKTGKHVELVMVEKKATGKDRTWQMQIVLGGGKKGVLVSSTGEIRRWKEASNVVEFIKSTCPQIKEIKFELL